MRRSKYDTDEPIRIVPAAPVERPRQTMDAWINDLCVCKECRDGFVSFVTNGYETLYACPVCDRSKRDLHPYQSIPSAKKWMGSFTKYSEHEMAQRRMNRVEVVESLRKGAARVPTFDTEEVGGPF